MVNYASLSKFTRNEILSLFASTVMRFKKGGLDLRFAPAKKEFGRILIIIPKRAGSAPLRNRLKRRLKALFYENKWHEKKIDCIVSAHKEATRLTYTELCNIFETAFSIYDKKFNRHSHSLV